jgi:hypothetical protein
MTFIEELQPRLEHREPAPPLYPQTVWDTDISKRILAASAEELIGHHAAHNQEMVAACRCGLLLWNDDLDESHRIAQGIETPTGSFWHAIMHRREGDANNSKHWWRNTDSHPAFPAVQQAVLEMLDGETAPEALEFATLLRRSGTWEPAEFVDRCEAARNGKMNDGWLRCVQVAEIVALLDWCYATATHGS